MVYRTFSETYLVLYGGSGSEELEDCYTGQQTKQYGGIELFSADRVANLFFPVHSHVGILTEPSDWPLVHVT